MGACGVLWDSKPFRGPPFWWSSDLRLCAPNAGGLSSIPGQGTGSHRCNQGFASPQLKILHAETKTENPTCHN